MKGPGQKDPRAGFHSLQKAPTRQPVQLHLTSQDSKLEFAPNLKSTSINHLDQFNHLCLCLCACVTSVSVSVCVCVCVRAASCRRSCEGSESSLNLAGSSLDSAWPAVNISIACSNQTCQSICSLNTHRFQNLACV